MNLILTERLIGTYEGDRYHARTVYMGAPSIVSGGGAIEGPAKPEEYYERRTTATGEDVPTEIAKEGLEADFLEYGDTRLTEVSKGLALQALVYRISGEEFCDDRSCRLYNAHTQKALLRSQLGGKLCSHHEEVLSETRKESGT